MCVGAGEYLAQWEEEKGRRSVVGVWGRGEVGRGGPEEFGGRESTKRPVAYGHSLEKPGKAFKQKNNRTRF